MKTKSVLKRIDIIKGFDFHTLYKRQSLKTFEKTR